MVQQIDFLPDSFRLTQHRKKKTIWRRGVLIVFVALICAAAFQQQGSRMRLQAQRDRLQREAIKMTGQLENADALREEIRELDVRADLTATLQLRPSASRILATVSATLPRYTTLRQISSEYRQVETAKNSKRGKSRSRQAPAAEEEPGMAQERDLKRLREEASQQALFLTLEGIAPDDLAISTYMAALQESTLFDEVRLSFTDRYEYQETSLRQFAIQLRVRRPGKLDEQQPDSSQPTAANLSGPVAIQWATPGRRR